MKVVLVSAAAVAVMMSGAMAQTSDDSSHKATEKVQKEKPASEKSKAKDEPKYISPDKGIGPVKELKLGPIDTVMAERGKKLYNEKCTTCHLMDKKKLGPPLRTVTKNRPPEFIMNMMINTDEMEKKDAEVKKMIDEYQVYMTVLDITEKQARDLLEYLRQEGEKKLAK